MTEAGSPAAAAGRRRLRRAVSIAGAVAALFAAAVLIFAWAWILTWHITWGGLKGSDSAYHLHLANWVAASFPNLDWWYRWDGMGMSYRESYPLLPSWFVAGLAHASGWSNAQAMQAIQFLINPLCAIGLYAFAALRLKNPLVGLAAGLLYLISPIAFTFLINWGFFANQVGTVLVPPALIALDIAWSEWHEGRRGRRFRAAAASTIVLCTLTGLVSPTVFGAPLVLIVLYALACGGMGQALRWLGGVVPWMALAIGGLSAFWGLTLFDALGATAARAPQPTYDPQLFVHWDLRRMLELLPMRPGHVEDTTAFALPAWVPAVPALAAVVWDARVRVLAAAVACGFVITSVPQFDQLFFATPVVDVLNNRVGLTLVQLAVPLLAGYGLAGLLAAAARFVVRRRKLGRTPRLAVAGAGLALALIAVGADLGAYAASLGTVDLWQQHVDNPCVGSAQDSKLCGTAIAVSFNVLELTNACLGRDLQLRAEIEVCADLGSGADPTWSSQNDPAIGRLVDRCRASGDTYDRVCTARYASFVEQVGTLSRWRPPQVGCYAPACTASANIASGWNLFPPARAVVDAHSGALLESFHDITGGGQFYTYLEQGIPSPELDDFMKGSMLDQPGSPGLKAELAAVTGADAVVLAQSQAGLAGDYQAIGWQEAAGPTPGSRVMINPAPSGLAAQWTGATSVLVVGQVAADPSHPYNDLFKSAVNGMIPFNSGWLVRSRSPYIDDYSSAELARYPALVVLAYRYHDQGTAWRLLDGYVRGGGRLFVETGWQYTDPDWSLTKGLSPLPVTSLAWGPLDPSATPVVEGAADPHFGSLGFEGGGWGASSTSAVSPGAEALVQVGSKIVVARSTLGRGRVIWSGMNLIAHSMTAGSADEDSFLARQFAWLLGAGSPELTAPAVALTPMWTGNDRASLALQASSGPASVLFKESMAPGWTAQLVWPGGSRNVTIEPSEMDFMLVRLDSIPAGSQLVFTYGPTVRIYVYWALSVLVGIALLGWLYQPGPLRRIALALRGLVRRTASAGSRRFGSEEDG